MGIKLISIRKASHWDSLWNRGERQLGNRLLFHALPLMNSWCSGQSQTRMRTNSVHCRAGCQTHGLQKEANEQTNSRLQTSVCSFSFDVTRRRSTSSSATTHVPSPLRSILTAGEGLAVRLRESIYSQMLHTKKIISTWWEERQKTREVKKWNIHILEIEDSFQQ